jgi:hypothetical protein
MLDNGMLLWFHAGIKAADGMAQELLYSTTLRIRGPWLLEAKQLLALDDILGDNSEDRKSLTVFLSKERELKTSSFKEAMAHIGSQNEVAKGF